MLFIYKIDFVSDFKTIKEINNNRQTHKKADIRLRCSKFPQIQREKIKNSQTEKIEKIRYREEEKVYVQESLSIILCRAK